MYRHIVLFWLKDASEANAMIARDKLRSLAGKIEGLLSLEVELDACRSERSCDLCLNMVFETKASLDAYRTHPAHIQIQEHIHAVRSLSHAADYPIANRPDSVPKVFGTLGPACAGVQTLCKLLHTGLAGMRLSLRYRTFEECAAWVEALHTACAHTGIAAELLIEPADGLPASIHGMGATGVMLPVPHTLKAAMALRARLGESLRLYGLVSCAADMDALPVILAATDEVVVERRAMTLTMPVQKVPLLQRRVALASLAEGKPYGITSDLLSSMREKPVPTAAEITDIYAAMLYGVSSFFLTNETSIGKYPVETVEVLRKTVETALLEGSFLF